MRICNKCNKAQELKCFSKKTKHKDWLSNICKTCIQAWIRTKEGLITRIYWNQRWNSKTKWFPMPNYTKQELHIWLCSQIKFHALYNNRQKNWYKKALVPSVDRINDYKWYSLDNIQLMTWKENKDKWHKDRLSWKNSKFSCAVRCINLQNKVINIYCSMMEWERITWVKHQSISSCCNGKLNRAWKYKWEYVR